MMQYQNQQMCNTGNCKRCPRKQGCFKYLSYLENIVSTPISTISPTLSNTPHTFSQSENTEISSQQPIADLSYVNELLSTYQNSTTELISNYSIDSANKFKSLLEMNNGLIVELSEIKNTVIELNEKISKLDSFIKMVELHNTQNGNVEPRENSVTVYSEASKPEDVLVEKTTKGFLGLGKKTTWTKENSN